MSSGGWFVFSSQQRPELAAHRRDAATDRGHLYVSAQLADTWLEIDDSSPGDWPVTRLNVDDGRLFTSVMYPSCIYLAESDDGWALSSDPLLLTAERDKYDWSVAVGEVAGVDRAGGTVRRLPPFSEHCPGTYTESLANDPIEAIWRPTRHDAQDAGERLLEALKTSVAAMIASDTAPPAVLLSGGVDSAALAWAAHELGLAPVAYSIGTTWGNEHAEAAELAAHCGLTHRRIDLTVDELIGAIRPSIRQLGHADPESVDSVLNVVAVLRRGQIEERTVLTGWGSDLLNCGLLHRQDAPVVMNRGLLASLRRTQLSSEFGGLIAGMHGYRLCHPYWHRSVVETSLSIDVSCKYGPREKQHLRTAMAAHVPESVAWRKKVALHHGTGVESGLAALFGGEFEKARVYAEVFEDLASRSTAELLDELMNPWQATTMQTASIQATALAERI